MAGTIAFVGSLFLYRSYQQRTVLGLWSPTYALVLVCALALLALCVALTLRSVRSRRQPSNSARLFDFAILFGGGAYLMSAIDNRDNAGRIIDLNLFGSVAPLPAHAEWIAMVVASAAGIGWAWGKLAETGRKFLLTATALAIVLLIGEGALRLRAVISPSTQGFPTYTSAQWTRRNVQLNSEGFRDIEHPHETPGDERRMLIVGDSYAFGSGLDEIDSRLGEELARELSERIGERWHSMSAALGDSDTLDEIEYLEQMGPYERDAVLLLYVFNDIDYLVPVTPRTLLTEHPTSILGRLHPARILFLNSYLFQEIFVRVRMAIYALNHQVIPSKSPYSDDAVLARHLDDLVRFVELASKDRLPVWIARSFTCVQEAGRGLLTAIQTTSSPIEGADSDTTAIDQDHLRPEMIREAISRPRGAPASGEVCPKSKKTGSLRRS
jgi:hypothetical protein